MIPNGIDETHKKTVIHDFQTAIRAKHEQSKKSESQEPDVDQSNKVAASKLSDLKGKAPEEGKIKTAVPEEKMALEREIAELRRKNEELANQLRILNERLEEKFEESLKERLEEVARKEHTILLQGQDWIQRNFTVNLREKVVREKDALQEAKSTTLLQREKEVLRREEQVLEREEKMAQLQNQLNRKETTLAKRERLVNRFFKERRIAMPKEEDLEPDL
ncbi:hypothetical protein BGAL_0244g00040 [Botrytis galanthina]|uniref:Uncharacterized protein n=1 Tax=Botrytis galanthina TaxID=278940 RepID=A0A4S8QTM7_9HELO|nr:hypothetical protein BGAL_0244g00040 [Botrytis galanthina]